MRLPSSLVTETGNSFRDLVGGALGGLRLNLFGDFVREILAALFNVSDESGLMV